MTVSLMHPIWQTNSQRLASMSGHASSNSQLANSSSIGSRDDRDRIDYLFRVYLENSQCAPNGKTPGNYSLAACRSQQQSDSCVSPLDEELRRAVIGLTGEYQRQYSAQLKDLFASFTVSEADPHESFKQVLDDIFLDDCNWGRVITMFVFATMFLQQCRQQEQRQASQLAVSPVDVHQWSVDYMTAKVLPWIKRNGDWMGLVRFYQVGDTQQQQQAGGGGSRSEDGGTLKRLLTVAGAGLALFNLVNRA